MNVQIIIARKEVNCWHGINNVDEQDSLSWYLAEDPSLQSISRPNKSVFDWPMMMSVYGKDLTTLNLQMLSCMCYVPLWCYWLLRIGSSLPHIYPLPSKYDVMALIYLLEDQLFDLAPGLFGDPIVAADLSTEHLDVLTFKHVDVVLLIQDLQIDAQDWQIWGLLLRADWVVLEALPGIAEGVHKFVPRDVCWVLTPLHSICQLAILAAQFQSGNLFALVFGNRKRLWMSRHTAIYSWLETALSLL